MYSNPFKMKKIFIVFASLSMLLIICCRKDEPIIPANSCYYYGYMDYPGYAKPDPDVDYTVDIIYNGDKIVKRIGDLIAISPSTGYNYKYTDSIYDELTYFENSISIIKKTSYQGLSILPDERVIYLDDQDKMILEVFPTNSLFDSIYYSYDAKGLLIESKNKKGGYLIESSNFYYNSQKNLDSIITHDNLNENIKVEIFSNYDNAYNPLKQLIIFKETFKRSLSKNNYLKYNMKLFNADNILIGSAEKTWTLNYDENGNPEFSRH
jgi:hypothetical protein